MNDKVANLTANQDDPFRIIVVSEDSSLIERLTDGLRSTATLAAAEPDVSLVDELIDGLDADLLVLDLDARPAGGEGLLDIVRMMKERRPGLPIVASGDSLSAQLVLSAMRAGAVDFIDRDISTDEARVQVGAHLHRHHDRTMSKAQGVLHVIASAREDQDVAIAAVNLAAAFAANGAKTLLIDLSAQGDEAALALGLEPTYTVEDAMVDLPRLDETLLLGALANDQNEKLYLLPARLVNSNALAMQEVLDPAKLNSLLTLVRPFFDQIVIYSSGGWLNIGLGPLLSISAVGVAFDYLAVQPNMISVSGASRLLRQIFGQAEPEELARTGLRLLVVNEEPGQNLSAHRIADTLGLPLAGTLPAAPLHHPEAVNEGVALVVEQPTHPYSLRVRNLLLGEDVTVDAGAAGIIGRVRSLINRS
ncbi:MAG: hypothetical protein ABF335_09985 [Alphaproteobacteria bacterium]